MKKLCFENHEVKIELDTQLKSWTIYHSKDIATTILELKDWFKNLPLFYHSIIFINESGKIYQTSYVECFHVIGFLSTEDIPRANRLLRKK